MVIVAIVFGLMYMKRDSTKGTVGSNATTTAQNATTTAAVPDTSDEALDRDVASMDAQLQVIEQHDSQVDESLKDKPVQQSE